MIRFAGSFRTLLILAIPLFGATVAPAQEDETLTKRWAAWQFYGENDALAAFSGSDEYYTNGLRFVWIRNPNVLPNPDWTRDLVDRWCQTGLCTPNSFEIAYGHAFGHNFYTPETITDPNPRPNDRPWAGYLYYSWLVQATHITDEDWNKDQPVQNLFELQLGIVGPEAGAEFVQREFHQLIGDDEPLGWDNQLDTEPTLNLTYLWRKKVGTSTIDVVPHWGAGLGNVMTWANAGATVRLGHNISSFPQLLITPTNASLTAPPPTPTEFFLFVAVDGRGVARNIFLDGNTFGGGPEIDIEIKRFVYDLRAGFSVRVRGWRFDYSFVRRSEEFEPPPGREDGLHDFGSFTISRTLWRR